jgi:Tfp pilus assembly PilM family ATPase
MFQSLFLPTRHNGYYLAKQRIVSFSITSTSVRAILSIVKGRSEYVEELFEQSFQVVEDDKKQVVIAAAIDTILKSIGSFDQVNFTIPSDMVITRSLTLPFTDPDKIRMVLPYEVESLIPFSQDQVIVDAILGRVDTKKDQTEVLAVIVPRDKLATYVEPFIALGVTPTRISTPSVDLYGLIDLNYGKQIQDKAIVVVDIDYDSTQILVINNGALTYTRNLPSGLQAVAQLANSNDPDSAMDHLKRFGFGQSPNEELGKPLTKALNALVSSVALTMAEHPATEAILVGPGARIQGLDKLLAQLLGISCTAHTSTELFEKTGIKSRKNLILKEVFLKSLTSGLAQTRTSALNLGKQYLIPAQKKHIKRQLFTSLFLLILLVIGLLGSTWYQSSNLAFKAQAMEQAAIKKLRTLLPKQLKGRKKITDLIQAARFSVAQEESGLSAITRQSKTLFLFYLQALFTSIDSVSLGLVTKRLKIDRDSVILDGTVKGYPELKTLEHEINASEVFSLAETPQETTFSITLSLNKDVCS